MTCSTAVMLFNAPAKTTWNRKRESVYFMILMQCQIQFLSHCDESCQILSRYAMSLLILCSHILIDGLSVWSMWIWVLSCQRKVMPRLDIKQISGESTTQWAPASSSFIHVGFQGSFQPNGVSGTIPPAQRHTENTPNGAIESHWFFLSSQRLISNLSSSGPISSLPSPQRAPPCVCSIHPPPSSAHLTCTCMTVPVSKSQ